MLSLKVEFINSVKGKQVFVTSHASIGAPFANRISSSSSTSIPGNHFLKGQQMEK